MSAYTKQLLAFADILTRLHTQTTTPADYTATLTTLATITRNLLTTPLPNRYTTLNLTLPVLQQRLARYPAAVEWLRLIGFEREAGSGEAEVGKYAVRGEVDRKAVDVAVQVIEGGLEEAKRDEEKAASKQQQLAGTAESSEDVVMRSSQEEDDRKLSERLQREENGRNNSRPSKAAAAGTDYAEEKEERESEADMRVQLHADYNISDVKRALSALKQQIQSSLSSSSTSSATSSASLSSSSSSSSLSSSQSLSSSPSNPTEHAASDTYLASLSLLHKITTNLRTREDKYRTLKLTNPTLHTKLAVYPAALDYLHFLGFTERDERVMRIDSIDSVRVERAAAIISRVIQAETPSDEEREHRTLGPVDRELHVMSYEPAMLNDRLAAREEEPPVSDAPDMKLLMTVAAEDRRRNEMYARTDAFLTRNKQAELKQRYKRHYTRTLLRVVCQPDNTLVTAYFRPLDRLSALFDLLTPLVQPDKAATFVLRLPPQQKLTAARDGGKTLAAVGLVPAATLYIGGESDSSSAVTPTRWLRDEVWQQRTAMVAVPVPVAENAAEIAEKKKEDRMAASGGGGGGEAGGRGGGSSSERKGDADEMDDDALERELKRMKAEKAKQRSAAADAAAKRAAR